MEGSGISQSINLGCRWRCVFSCTSRPRYVREQTPQGTFNSRLAGPQGCNRDNRQNTRGPGSQKHAAIPHCKATATAGRRFTSCPTPPAKCGAEWPVFTTDVSNIFPAPLSLLTLRRKKKLSPKFCCLPTKQHEIRSNWTGNVYVSLL
jgi:hypothetical protein